MKTIHVTQEDIDTGKQNDIDSCALALAISREMGATWQTGIYCTWAKVTDHTTPIIDLPESARNWLRKFDAHGNKRYGLFKLQRVRPITFGLDSWVIKNEDV